MKKIEHNNHCTQIAENLKKYADGRMAKCPNCGEVFEDSENCPYCEEELEEQSLFDYFEDALDIEYRIGSDREYRSARIMIACGGPNIYIDTQSGKVELYWWNEEGEAWIDDEVVDVINEFLEELYNC